MDKLLSELEHLSKSTKILQPDQTLQNLLIPLRLALSDDNLDMNNEKLKNIEAILLQLLKINKGDLGTACSLEIGHNLYLIYKHDPNKHFWNLISDVTKNPTEANIYAIKFVISNLGKYNKSSLNQIAQLLLSLKKPKLFYPALLALRSLFKECRHSFPKLVQSAFNFAKTCALNNSERIRIAAIQLLQVLIFEPEINVKKVLLIAQQVFADYKSKFVNFTTANLVAQCAINPFLDEIKEKEKNEEDEKISNQLNVFHIGPLPKEHILAKSFEILLMFKSQFSDVFGLFLDKMPPYLVYLNIELLFNFIIRNSMKDITQLIAFFGQDVRSLFFSAVMSQKNIDFCLLCQLVFNNDSAKEAAGVAHDKIWCNNPVERKEAKKFFASLSNVYPNAALESLHVALHYIAMPPDDSPTMKMEYSGQATVASILLSSLKDKCESELPLLEKYIKFTLSENSKDDFFLESLFMILNTQDDEFISKYNIQEILDRIFNSYASKIPTDFTTYPINLIENVLIFYAYHQNYPNVQKFCEFCFQIADHLSLTALLELIHAFYTLDISESFAFSMAIYLLNKSFTQNISLKHIKKRVPELMKIPDELFFREAKTKFQKSELVEILYFSDNSLLISKIIDFIPTLVKKMNAKNASSFFNAAIHSSNICAGHMIILSILQEAENDSSLFSKIPSNIHILLTKAISNESDEIKLQITSECIATYIKNNPNEMSSLFPFLRQQSIASCFIETALARIVKMTEDSVAYIIVQATNRMKKESLSVYVLHELSTIFNVKSLQLMNMMIGEQQCQQLITLVTGKDIPIFTMYYAALCFEKLIPILLPTLHEKPTMNMILVFLNELWNSSIKFYKKFFFDLFRQLFAFSKEVADFFVIKPPRKAMIIDARISACGAIADLAKAKPFQSSILEELPPFFVLLQRTRSNRVNNFLLSAVNSFCETLATNTTLNEDNIAELQKWFNLTHQLLSANSMVGFGDVNVEPNTCVKQTTLLILKALMKPLSMTDPFLAECLDDVMTSAIRSIESKNVDLYKCTYEILEESLKLFKEFKTDQNVRLLSLYESQYTTAIRSAFPSSLDVAYKFLCQYIDFAFEQYKLTFNGKEGCKQLISSLVDYVDRIKEKEKKRTTGYYAIVTKIAVISEKYNEIFESICKEFLLKQVPHFRSLMVESMKLRTMSRTDEWQRITEFRMEISPFYSNFLSSFVWLQKKFPLEKFTCSFAELKIQSLIDFFISEASAPEIWRITAAFGAMSAGINYFGDAIGNKEFQAILDTCCKVFKSNKINVLPMMPDFLQHTSRCLSKSSLKFDTPIWPQLTSLALSSKSYPETIGMILKNSTEEELNSKDDKNLFLAVRILIFVLNEFLQKVVTEEEATAIVTVLLFKCPSLISSFIDQLFVQNEIIEKNPKLVMTVLERASNHLSINDQNSPLCGEITKNKISQFLVAQIKSKDEDALRLAAVIAIKIPSTGSAILNDGVIDETINNYDGISPLVLLNFYDLVLSNFNHSQEVSEKIADIAANLILLHGNDRVSGLKVTSKAVSMIKKCSSYISSASENVFTSFNELKQSELLRILHKYTKKSTIKKISLKKFTNNSSYKRNNGNDDGWQNLDDESD